MIAIIEPLCKKISHEKINSGFLTLIRLAFPNEKILFYAHKSHIDAIINILKNDNVIIENISYIKIPDLPNSGIISLFKYSYVFFKILSDLKKRSIDKIFFLSFSSSILFLLKKFKLVNKFSYFKYVFVLHGSFEDIAAKKKIGNFFVIPKFKTFVDFIKYLYNFCTDLINFPWNVLNFYCFNFNNVFKHNHSNDIRYVALSPYIIENAKEFIDIIFYNIHLVDFPINFAKPKIHKKNKNIIFGVFGYGNSKKLIDISRILIKENFEKKFEIKIIGMDNRGLSGFPFIKFTSNGNFLTRRKMEQEAQDVDIFLILYESNKYRLSCSGSIFEALSYCKPIIHLENDCIDFYNNKNLPIGISCKTDFDLAITIKTFIENTEFEAEKIGEFRKNILLVRDKYKINNSIKKFKKVFTW